MGFLSGLGNLVSGVLGAIPGIGTVGSAIASGLGIVGSELGKQESMDFQREMMQQNHEWQSQENQIQRDWQSEQWQKQFDLTNAYNTPEQQVKRLLAAGINPVSGMTGAGASAASGSAIGQAVPSGASGFSPSPDYSGVLTQGYNNMHTLMENLKLLGETKKAGIENSRLSTILDTQIAETVARMNNEQAQADLTSLTKKFEEIFGVQRRSKELDKLISEYVRNYADAKLAASQGSYYDAAAVTQAADALLKHAQRALTSGQFDLLQIDLKYRASQLESEIARNRGTAAAGFGSAEQAHELAVTERDFREVRKNLLSYQAEVARLQGDYDRATLHTRVDLALQDLQHANVINQEEYQRLRQYTFQADAQEMDKFIERLQKTSEILNKNLESANSWKDFLYRGDLKALPLFFMK